MLGFWGGLAFDLVDFGDGFRPPGRLRPTFGPIRCQFDVNLGCRGQMTFLPLISGSSSLDVTLELIGAGAGTAPHRPLGGILEGSGKAAGEVWIALGQLRHASRSRRYRRSGFWSPPLRLEARITIRCAARPPAAFSCAFDEFRGLCSSLGLLAPATLVYKDVAAGGWIPVFGLSADCLQHMHTISN